MIIVKRESNDWTLNWISCTLHIRNARCRTRVNAVTAISINCKKKDVEENISPRIAGSPNAKLVEICDSTFRFINNSLWSDAPFLLRVKLD